MWAEVFFRQPTRRGSARPWAGTIYPRSPKRRTSEMCIRDSYKGWAHGLKACGYATNPRYAYKLIEIIELYKLYLYDNATTYDHFMAERSGVAQPVDQSHRLHPIRIFNKNYYMMAREGDTFKAIGKEIELSGRKIAKYNERNYHDVLQAGEIVYLKKKCKHAPKAFKNKPHIVQPGESMYSICLLYTSRCV